MKLIKKEYIKILEWGFKIAYLLLGLSTFNSFIYDSPIQPALVKVCLVLGVLAAAGRLLFLKDYIKMPYLPVLVLFCISFCLTIMVNWKYNAGVEDLKWVIWTGFIFFLLYTCDRTRSRNSYKKEFHVLADILIVLSVICALASIYLLLQNYHNLWTTESGEVLIAGFQWGRLWGVYTDPNYGGVFSVAAILLCVYFILIRKGLCRIWYVLAICADYIYVIFSDSRTAEVTMCAGAGVILLLLLYSRRKNWKGIAAGILLTAVFAGVFVGGTSLLKGWYNEQIEARAQQRSSEENIVSETEENIEESAEENPGNSGENSEENSGESGGENSGEPAADTGNAPVSSPEQKSEEAPQEPETEEQETVGRAQDIQTDVSNGRFDLWKSGIEIWKTKPVTGTGYNSFLPYVEETLPDTYVVNNDQGNYVSLHNGYLNILVYQGILGAVISLVFIGGVLWSWFRGIKSVPRKDSLYITFLSATVVVIAVSMLFLLEGIYTNSPGTFILWSFLGYLMHYFSDQAEEKR